MPKRPESYYDILTAAIVDLSENGYDSAERVQYWTEELRKAALRTMRAPAEMERALREALAAIYRRLIDQRGILRFNIGVERFTLDRVKPQLRAELDRRILASANLIRLNRDEAISKTLRRFQGWATSIPAGGSKQIDRKKSKEDIRKSLRGLPFEERRCLIDQGRKLRASLSDILAVDGGAIAGIWHSHFRDPGYDYRPDHKDRDGKVYLLRESWARDKGLVKAGAAGYTDQITQPAEEPYCRCFFTWLYALQDLPKDMLTKKGADELERVRTQLARMA